MSYVPQHGFDHVSTMVKLIAENRYDRLTSDVQKLTGKSSMSVREYVTAHPEVFSTAAVMRETESLIVVVSCTYRFFRATWLPKF